jgi:hypothetical protein
MQDPAAPVPGAKFWFEGREFVSEPGGCAVIPFMDHPKTSAVVASAPGGHASARLVDFAAESWEVSVSVLSPHEAFVPGCSTSIILRCGLHLSSTHRLQMPLSELQSPSVSLDALDESGTTIQTSVTKVTFSDSCDLVLPWIYPLGCCVLNVKLSATVAFRSTANKRTVSVGASASVSMPPAPASFQPDAVALIQAASTRSDMIVPHLRLTNGKYWLDVSVFIE